MIKYILKYFFKSNILFIFDIINQLYLWNMVLLR